MKLPLLIKPPPPDRPINPAKDRLTVSKDGAIEGVGKAVVAAYRLAILTRTLKFAAALVPVALWIIFRA